MSSSEIYKSASFKLEAEYDGRAGCVFYIEKSRLPFYFELISGKKLGRGLEIPTQREWDSFCEKHEASWAIDRREEIIQTVGQVLAKKWYGNGTYEIEANRWLNIYHGPSLLQRLLNKLGL